MIPAFTIVFLITDIGPWEWAAIALILLYPMWLSRDHWDQALRPMVANEPAYKRLNQDERLKFSSLDQVCENNSEKKCGV